MKIKINDVWYPVHHCEETNLVYADTDQGVISGKDKADLISNAEKQFGHIGFADGDEIKL